MPTMGAVARMSIAPRRFSRRHSSRVYAEEQAVDLSTQVYNETHEAQRAFFRHLLHNDRKLPPLGSPFAPYRRVFSMVLLALAALEACYIPFMAAFALPKDRDGAFVTPAAIVVLQWLVDLLFWVDILLMFRTTLRYRHVDGSEDFSAVISDTKVIVRTYLRSSFALDVRASAPTSTAREARMPGRL